jgi:hypothetical protein
MKITNNLRWDIRSPATGNNTLLYLKIRYLSSPSRRGSAAFLYIKGEKNLHVAEHCLMYYPESRLKPLLRTKKCAHRQKRYEILSRTANKLNLLQPVK